MMHTRLHAQDSAATTPVFTPAPRGLLQPKCACGASPGLAGECDECGQKPMILRRQTTGQSEPSTVPPIVHDVLRSPGQPLDSHTRAFMEPRFGHDFSQVRIHIDSRAAESARAVNSLAYTVAGDVVFGQGQYAPDTAEGRKVLAHELTHVVQQGGLAGETLTHVGQPHDSYEQEADRMASDIGASSSAIDRSTNSATGIHPGSMRLQRLGANPSCTNAEAKDIHQAIFDARGWLNKAIPQLEASPLAANVLASLRRNFGPTYGVAANASLIVGRLRVARTALGSMSFACDTPGTTPLCIANHCGWALPGSNAATICTNPPSTLGLPWPFSPECMLHESIHASMGFMTIDNYKTAGGYPGPGTQPLLNSDSYTQLTKEMS